MDVIGCLISLPSIINNGYIDEKKCSMTKKTFSIVKNIYDGDIAKPVLLFDLINQENNYLKKKQLIKDGIDVLKRFTGKSILEIKIEYDI